MRIVGVRIVVRNRNESIAQLGPSGPWETGLWL
jgi:hypothetical protein